MTELMVLSLTVVGVLIIILGILRLRHITIQSLIVSLAGAILGLLLGALASVPLSKLPEPFGDTMPLAVTAVLTTILMVGMLSRQKVLIAQLPFLNTKTGSEPKEDKPTPESKMPPILVDTSAIIDGRIADIAEAGFMPGRLFVPRFVLAELQNIADSEDAMRRGRGRRGLDVLNRLREMPDLETEIIEDDVAGIREVDAKLVALGQKFHCNVLTTDYNLNRVAQIQGVRVLNVNELSNAIRPVVLPGEELMVRVVQPGKERNQGVGYLADGTMIVVENGDKLIGQEVSTEVTRVFQTVAGKMIFAVPRTPVSSGPAPRSQAAAPTTAANAPAADKKVAASGDEKPAQSPEKDAQRKSRFNNRNRKRSSGNGGGNGGDSRPQQSQPQHQPGGPKSIEDRIIAATSKPQPKTGR